VTVTKAVPGVRPAALAVSRVVCVPSATVSSTGVTGKVAEAEPAGIVTLVGTVAAVLSLLLRRTRKSAVVAPLRVTVPTAAAEVSLKVLGLTLTFNVCASEARLKPNEAPASINTIHSKKSGFFILSSPEI
jgi:hypothetical protein